MRDKKVGISLKLKCQIMEELAKQGEHRIEDNASETKKVMKDLDEVNEDIQLCRKKSEKLKELENTKGKLTKRLHALKKEDSNSDAFLDRDNSAYTKRF